MAYPSPRQLQLRRGNTAAVSAYVGLAGEITINTDDWTIRVYDGSTPGGHQTTVNTASITGNINSILNGTAVFANLIPSANVTYSLGNVTHQWNDLYVSNNTIYVGGVPLGIDNTGNLTINGNVIPTLAYVNAQVANVTVDLSSYALNANVTAANVGLKGYVDQANSIQSSAISSANIAIKGYIDQQITDLIGGAPSILDTLNEIAASINDDANVYTSLINSIATANTALKGYIDLANTIQSAQISAANVGIIGYIDLANTIQSAQVGAANLAITAANVGLKGYVDFANTTMKSYVDGQITAANANVSSSYSNVQVATYLPTYSGNISANISKAGYTWTFGTDGTTQFPNSLILAPASQSITMQSDQYSQLMWQNANVTVAPNMAINSNFYVAQNNATLDIGYRDGSSTQLIKSWYWNVDGNLKLPSGGYILNSDDSIYGGGGGNYGNVEVATYLQSGNIANVSVAGNVTATYFVGNGAFLTGVVGGASNYGNIDVKAFLGTDAGFDDGYQRVIEGYYANVILGDTTKLFSFGNSSKSYFGHDGFLGNASINYIRADNADVRIATNNGAYAWIFDRYGNLTLSGNTFSVNYANGTPVTFSSSSYSNVQVATYLPTYSGVVTASNVAVAGNVTAQYLFGNGSQLTGIASSYSNVQTAAYLNATGYNLYSNVNVASYLTTATITTTGNVTAGNLITGGALYVANITTTGSSGNISGANYITANVILTNGGWGNISQVALITANVVTATSYIKVTPTTVANLISASTVGAGARDFVTDANTITFGSVVGGSGANNMPVFSNGTSWLIG
jgi:hypothetical protein